MASALLASGHPYKDTPPNDPGFRPEFVGFFLDAWDASSITASGAAPDESVSRATERTVASVSDKYLTEAINVTGTVEHKRSPEDPFEAIDDSRGRRPLWFEGGGFISVPQRQKRGLPFSISTAARPVRIMLGMLLKAGATRTGDGTIFACGGYSLAVGADLRDLTWTADRATTDYTKTFANALPTPEVGWERCTLEVVWDATTPSMKLYLDGEEISGSETAGSGAFVSVATSALTIGGRDTGTNNGLDFGLDFSSGYRGSDRTDDILEWVYSRPTLTGSTQTRVEFPDLDPETDRLYNVLRGDDGLGLTLFDLSAIGDASSTIPNSWAACTGGRNQFVLIRANGITTAHSTRISWEITRPNLMWLGLGRFALEGSELRLVYKPSGPERAAANVWGERTYHSWGRGLFSVEGQNEGAPIYIVGQNTADGSITMPQYNFTFRHPTFVFTGDVAVNLFWRSDHTYIAFPLVMLPIRTNAHTESPNHDFGALAANMATKLGSYGGKWYGHNQRLPSVLGAQGNAPNATVGYAEHVHGRIITPNAPSRNYGGIAFGQPNNNATADTQGAFYNIKHTVFEPPTGNFRGLMNPNGAPAPAPANPSRYHARAMTMRNSGVIPQQWRNSKSYGVLTYVVDPDDGLWYVCDTAHTSPASGTMADDRAANPTRWTATGYDFAQSFPQWGSGAGPTPKRRAFLDADLDARSGAEPGNIPTFIGTYVASYEAGELVEVNRLSVAHPQINSPYGTGVNAATEDELLGFSGTAGYPTRFELDPSVFSLAGATAGDPQWATGLIAFADLPDSAWWEANIGVKISDPNELYQKYMALQNKLAEVGSFGPG